MRSVRGVRGVQGLLRVLLTPPPPHCFSGLYCLLYRYIRVGDRNQLVTHRAAAFQHAQPRVYARCLVCAPLQAQDSRRCVRSRFGRTNNPHIFVMTGRGVLQTA